MGIIGRGCYWRSDCSSHNIETWDIWFEAIARHGSLTKARCTPSKKRISRQQAGLFQLGSRKRTNESTTATHICLVQYLSNARRRWGMAFMAVTVHHDLYRKQDSETFESLQKDAPTGLFSTSTALCRHQPEVHCNHDPATYTLRPTRCCLKSRQQMFRRHP